MSDAVKQAAREAASQPVLRALARAGFVAAGIVHIGIGILAVVIAFGGRARADQVGAFAGIAAVPAGLVVVWVIAIALWALAVWYVVESVLVRGEKPAKWGARIAAWSKAIAYACVGVIAAVVAVGAAPNSERSAKEVGSTVLQLPAGPWLLGAAGIGIASVGVFFVFRGVAFRFRNDIHRPSGPLGNAVDVAGLIGFVAKGLAILAFGVLLIVAAVKVDPAATGGLDGALEGLIGLPLGPLLVAGIGAGLIVYGVYMFGRAVWERL